MKYKLTVTEYAEEMLDRILYYIINQLKNPQSAVNLVEELELVYGNLENNPKIYGYSNDTVLKSKGYRKAVVAHYDYVIIFRIDEVTTSVYIVGIFHDLELYQNKVK